MKKVIFGVLLLLSAGSIQAQSIKDLDFLIGKWEVSEVVFPGTDREYTESGIRECQYTMSDTYIECKNTSTTSTGKQRFSLMHFNYDKKKKRFLMTGMFTIYDVRESREVILDAENSMLHLIPQVELSGNRFFRSRIDFRDKDHYFWQGWSSYFGTGPEWSDTFREEAKRTK